MSETERPEDRGATSNPLLRMTAIVIYATLALLALTIPQSIVNWLEDWKSSNALQQTLLKGATRLQHVSEQARLTRPYREARKAFLAISGKDED
jgi:hypothetical protein